MSIKITIKKNINDKNIKNFVLFSNENYKINGLNKILLSNYSDAIKKTIDTVKIKNKNFLIFNLNPNQRIIVIKLKNHQTSLDNEKKGAEFYDYVKNNSILSSTFLENNIKETLGSF